MEDYTYVVFVYGTLKRNQRGNYLLGDSRFLGTAITKPKYQLFSCVNFPAMVKGNLKVNGDLYAVSETIKNQLDFYEGVTDGYYKFEEIEIEKISLVSFELTEILQRPINAYIFTESTEELRKIDEWPCISENLI